MTAQHLSMVRLTVETKVLYLRLANRMAIVRRDRKRVCDCEMTAEDGVTGDI